MGDGAMVGTLSLPVGPNGAGEPVAQSFTNGPVLKSNMQPPVIPAGTPYQGPTAGGRSGTSRCCRTIAASPRCMPACATCCLPTAASGRCRDENDDGLLNNGFTAASGGGYVDDQVELPLADVASLYALDAELPP